MTNINRRFKPAAIAAIFSLLVIAQAGCEEAEEFRAAAASSLRSGVQTIATGLIDGLFAVFEPDMTDDTTDT